MKNNPKIARFANIQIGVGLDADNVPVHIDWQAEDSPDTPEPVECKAFLLALFDKDHRDTYKIDLWTQEMQVAEMDKFMYQTLRGLSETYFKATQNTDLANDFGRFVQYFGEKTEVIAK